MEESYFVEAAMRYEELLESGQSISIEAFVAGEPSTVRAELHAFLQFDQDIGPLEEPIPLTSQQEHHAQAVIERARLAWVQETRTVQAQNLTMLRNAHKLTVGKLARQLQLPVDVLARIERGKVAVTTISQHFIQRVADVLQESIATVQAALSAPPQQLSRAPLSAVDGVEETEEPIVSFAQAFAESDPTPEERAAWNDGVL
jgi:transcriptional regulator with XRE-family HTH domain